MVLHTEAGSPTADGAERTPDLVAPTCAPLMQQRRHVCAMSVVERGCLVIMQMLMLLAAHTCTASVQVHSLVQALSTASCNALQVCGV